MRTAGIGIASRTTAPVRRDGPQLTAPTHLVPTLPRQAGLVVADAPPQDTPLRRDAAPLPVVETARALVPDIAAPPTVAPPRSPDAPSLVVAASVDAVPPQRDPSADRSSGAATPTAAATGPAAAEVADRPVVAPAVRLGGEAPRTPLGVKLGLYGVLALLTAFALRRPQPKRRPEPPARTESPARTEPAARIRERAIGTTPRPRDTQPVIPIRNGAPRYALAVK